MAGALVLLLNPGDRVDEPSRSAADLARQADTARDLGESASRSLQAVPDDPPTAERKPQDGGLRPAQPWRISIPSAGVNTEVNAVGTRRGAIRVPGIGLAGWWKGGPRPGERGRAVIIGHLDTARGPGLFAKVPSLKPRTLIAVTDRRRVVHRYRVIGSAQVQKDRFPTDQVYGGGRAPVLVLVTCGGPYEQGEGYRDNVLVYARASSVSSER